MRTKLIGFCGWGDGPDVGINVYKEDGGAFVTGYDLLPDEADKLADELQKAAQYARHMDKLWSEECSRCPPITE